MGMWRGTRVIASPLPDSRTVLRQIVRTGSPGKKHSASDAFTSTREVGGGDEIDACPGLRETLPAVNLAGVPATA